LRVAARSSAAKLTGRKGFLTNASVGVDPPVLPYLFVARKIASSCDPQSTGAAEGCRDPDELLTSVSSRPEKRFPSVQFYTEFLWP
jgi:hypothetical protein